MRELPDPRPWDEVAPPAERPSWPGWRSFGSELRVYCGTSYLDIGDDEWVPLAETLAAIYDAPGGDGFTLDQGD